jgi:hypothetical protein
MLELERLATNLFEKGNVLEWVQRGGAAKFDSPARVGSLLGTGLVTATTVSRERFLQRK